MKYSFDLSAEDYAAMSATLGVRRPQWLVSASVNAIGLGSILAILLNVPGRVDALNVLTTALGIGGFLFVVQVVALRPQLRAQVRSHFAKPPNSLILGPHTLELPPAALHSTGPLHTSFRSWPAMTRVVGTPTQLLFPTLFGAVYVLPLDAVPSVEEMLEFVREHSPGTRVSG